MRRVVVTGIGLVTPIAVGTEETWKGLLEGKSGIGPITHFDSSQFATHFAGEVKGFDVTRWMTSREARNIDKFIQYAIASASLAIEDSGLKIEGEFAERVGCYVGAGLGGVTSIEAACKTMAEKGPRHGISPFFVPMIIVNLAPGQISIRFGAKGPNFSHVSACSTGAHAIGEAMRAIERGDADAMICGGAEATVSPLGVGGFNSMRALSTRNDDPAGASRPFDLDRDGFVIAEGAGILVIEELEHAKQRGAKIYAELTGYAANSDAHHITAPAPEGEGAQRCMKLALKDAKLSAADIGYINAHGTSTKMNDVNETIAIKKVFGDAARQVMVSSTKSMTGH
ncbi:MAG TPA: beta-ketoacyl-ACP synthase II, partial [Polyangia bacterium]|nr:beta-ketoacyl-ACP synthase II [Polyangia bacterium]